MTPNPERRALSPTLPRARPASEFDEDDVPVCGWFESSHELSRGLQVTEHARFDGIDGDLPLDWWLRWQLRFDGAAASGSGLK